MWIRSQDKKVLSNINQIEVIDNEIYENVLLGQYETKERAIEILDNIQTAIICDVKVFEMPIK